MLTDVKFVAQISFIYTHVTLYIHYDLFDV